MRGHGAGGLTEARSHRYVGARSAPRGQAPAFTGWIVFRFRRNWARAERGERNGAYMHGCIPEAVAALLKCRADRAVGASLPKVPI
jgi:hypothetical protein